MSGNQNSGRWRKPVREHIAAGTYRRDRHGAPPHEANVVDEDFESIEPPTHLSASSGTVWRCLQLQYRIMDYASLLLLKSACESLDQAETARQALVEHGQTFSENGIPRPRPEVRIQRDAMRAFAATLKSLALDTNVIRRLMSGGE